MSNSLETPAQLLQAFQHRAKKHYGQHFLVDPTILTAIAGFAGVSAGDNIVEIGPGCGTLTLTMLQRGANVRAFEIDKDAIRFLESTLARDWPLTVVQGDVLRHDLRAELGDNSELYKCVANLPYNVGTEVFFRLADISEKFSTLVLMFQREVAIRMVASEKDKEYGVLSLMAQLYFDVELVMHLPPGAFVPPPKVHSAVVRCVPIAGTRIPDAALRAYFKRVVKSAFQQRRKTLPNGLKSLGLEKNIIIEAIKASDVSPKARPETVSFDEFLSLTKRLWMSQQQIQNL